MGRNSKQIATIADCRYLDSSSFPKEQNTSVGTAYTYCDKQWYNGGGGTPFQSVFCQGKSLGSINFGSKFSNNKDTTRKYYITVDINIPYEVIDSEPVAYYSSPATNANEQAVYIVLTKTNYCPNANNLTSSSIVKYFKCNYVSFPEYGSDITITGSGSFTLTYDQVFNNKTYYVWIVAKSSYMWLLYDRNNKPIGSEYLAYERLADGYISWQGVREAKDDYNEKQCPRASEAKKYFYTTSGLNLNVGNSLTSYMHLIKKSQTIRPDIIGWCSNNDAVPAALSSEQYYGIYGTTNYSNKNLTIDCTVYPSTTGSTSYGNATTKSLKYNTATRYTGTTLYPTDVKNGYFKLDIDFSFPAIQVNPSTIGKGGGTNIRLTRDVKVNVRVEHYGNAGTYNETYPVTFSQTGTVNTSTGIYTFDAVNVSKVIYPIPFYNGKSTQNPKIYIYNPTITWTTAHGGSSATSEIGLWEDE